MLAACTLDDCMTQRGIPAAGTVVERFKLKTDTGKRKA